ncbi:CoA-binding protein [bacterium]|nr:CoA-binding protein [bacterium]
MKRVAILGASNKKTRYSRMAQELLVENGYDVVPISHREENVLGVKTCRTVGEVTGKIDTLTVYVNPKHLAGYVDEIAQADIRRVIFNPGTETEPLEKQIRDSGKFVLEACTLVLLKTGQFDKS